MPKSPDPIDKHVGARVKLRRTLIGLSQEKLGDALGITFQQVQKYEKGTNRIGASRLQSAATVLGVPVNFFFEGAPTDGEFASGFADGPAPTFTDACATGANEERQLIQAFKRIREPKLRRRLIELVETMSANGAA